MQRFPPNMTPKPLYRIQSLRKHFQKNPVKASIGAKNNSRRELLVRVQEDKKKEKKEKRE